jgi:glycosyltransferase involved in cell wall biosynthesis
MKITPLRPAPALAVDRSKRNLLRPEAVQFERHVAIVGTAGVPPRYGGFETLAACLCEHFEATGPRLSVYCSSELYPERPREYHGAELRHLPLKANGWQSMLYDAASIAHAVVNKADAVLLLGVSGAFVLPFVRLLTSVHIVTNVDGVESRREKWGPVARRLLRALEWCAIRFSHEIIADNQGICEYLLREYGVHADVIPYGGDHVAPRGDEPMPSVEGPYALVIARIEPENNIDMILQAFDAPEVTGSISLVAIGNWSASEYGRQLRRRYSEKPGFSLLDAIYDRDRIRSLRAHASVYIHGHSAGGTNPSLVEAMFFPVPTVAFDCVFNRYTLTERGAYFGSPNALRSELLKPDAARRIDLAAVKALALERYTWGRVAAQYAAALGRSSGSRRTDS